jgi:hypothetical protein
MNPVPPPLIILFCFPNPFLGNHQISIRSVLGGVTYCGREFLNRGPFLCKTIEQLTEQQCIWCKCPRAHSHIYVQEAAGFPQKNDDSCIWVAVPNCFMYNWSWHTVLTN